MSKDRKRKKSRVKSKAAVITQAQQAKGGERRERHLSGPPRPGQPTDKPQEVVEFESRGSGGGLLSGMRGGFKAAVGVDRPTQKKGGWLDIALWIAVVVAALFFLYKKMG